MINFFEAMKVAIALALMGGGVLCGVWGAALLMTWLQRAMGL
jgi:hypothetical protein